MQRVWQMLCSRFRRRSFTKIRHEPKIIRKENKGLLIFKHRLENLKILDSTDKQLLKEKLFLNRFWKKSVSKMKFLP
jgi:hypothetical protein